MTVSPAGVVALQAAVGDGGGGSDKEGQGEGGQEYITAVLPGQGAYVLFLYQLLCIVMPPFPHSGVHRRPVSVRDSTS